MANYRDVDVGLRIDTLEAKLAERDDALAARNAELKELRADLAGELGGLLKRERQLTRIVAVAGGLLSAGLGFAYIAARADLERERGWLHDSIAMASANEAELHQQVAEAKAKLVACTNHGLSAPYAPTSAFGDNRAAVDKALDAAAREARKCWVAGQPTGAERVQMVFEPLDGNVTQATLDYGTFTGSAIEECILAPFRAVHVDAFKANRVTLTRELTIP